MFSRLIKHLRFHTGHCRKFWGQAARGYLRVRSLSGVGRVGWILRLVKTGAEGEEQATDIMEINRCHGLRDISDLGLTLTETKLLLASLQQQVVAAQAREHAVRRPACPCCCGVCRGKDD